MHVKRGTEELPEGEEQGHDRDEIWNGLVLDEGVEEPAVCD